MSIPTELLDELDRSNVLLFVGERLARDELGRLVIDQLTETLSARCQDVAPSDTFPQVAQTYEYERGRVALIQFMRDYLDPLGDDPQPAHQLIAALDRCNIFVTTALNRRLERALEAAGRRYHIVVRDEDVPFGSYDRVLIFKLRGDLSRPDALMLTEDDHNDFFTRENSISLVLQSYLSIRTSLFVGYDLDDPYFKQFYRKVTGKLGRFARRAYAFGEAPPPSVSRWCNHNGIAIVPVETADFLRGLIKQLAARKDEHSRPEVLLQGLLTVAPPKPVPLPLAPYKGLDFYSEQDAAIFWGRQREIEQCSSLIHNHRLVLLHGPSGAGKTSLILAGVTPGLHAADPPYEVIYVRALGDPVRLIREILQRRLPDTVLPDGPLVNTVVAAQHALNKPLAIVIDQFEEFFLRISEPSRASFVQELGALYDAQDVPLRLVIALREDWLAALGELEQRIPELLRVRLRLLPLQREQAVNAIVRPGEILGIGYEPSLVEQMLSDLCDGQDDRIALPSLQLVCSALYDRLKERPNTCQITVADYTALGGARGVLQLYLDQQLQLLPTKQRLLAHSLLEELISEDRTKKLSTVPEIARRLAMPPEEIDPVLGRLAKSCLVRRLSEQDGVEEPSYELVHEYLIDKIELSPEVLRRKEAEELLRQGVAIFHRYDALLNEDVLEIIEERRHLLRLSVEEEELLRRSSVRAAKSVERVVFALLAGIIGGALGGAFGGATSYALGFEKGNELASVLLGNALLVGVWYGIAIGFGFGFAQVWGRQHRWPLVVGSALLGALFGAPGVWLLGTPLQRAVFGALYGSGIVVSIHVGATLRSWGRIAVWFLLGVVVGIGAPLLVMLPQGTLPTYAWLGGCLSIGLGLANTRFSHHHSTVRHY